MLTPYEYIYTTTTLQMYPYETNEKKKQDTAYKTYDLLKKKIDRFKKSV